MGVKGGGANLVDMALGGAYGLGVVKMGGA